jgi:MFS family permease
MPIGFQVRATGGLKADRAGAVPVQAQLNLVAVSYSLGLACSVLWLGALGDRYGRKLMAILGEVLAMPALKFIIVEARGSRFTLLAGYFFVLLGFLTMLLLWAENVSYQVVGLAYSFVGIVLAGTPASRSLTGSVPVTCVGVASGTADLQRDLGGAINMPTSPASSRC